MGLYLNEKSPSGGDVINKPTYAQESIRATIRAMEQNKMTPEQMAKRLNQEWARDQFSGLLGEYVNNGKEYDESQFTDWLNHSLDPSSNLGQPEDPSGDRDPNATMYSTPEEKSAADLEDLIAKSRQPVTTQFMTEAIGEMPSAPVITDRMKNINSLRAPIVPIGSRGIKGLDYDAEGNLKAIPEDAIEGTGELLSALQKVGQDSDNLDYNARVRKYNNEVKLAQQDFENYKLEWKQYEEDFDAWVATGDDWIEEQNRKRIQDKESEIYWDEVELDKVALKRYRDALESGEISREEYEAAMNSGVGGDMPQLFSWRSSLDGTIRNSGNMSVTETGLFEYLNIPKDELMKMWKEDDAYIDLMGRELSGYGKSPQEVMAEQRQSLRGQSHVQMMSSSEAYRDAFEESERRSAQYEQFHMSMWMRDWMYQNTMPKRFDSEQAAAMEQHIYDRFGIKIPLNSDNTIGIDKLGATTDFMAKVGVGMMNTFTGFLGMGSAVESLWGGTTMTEGAGALDAVRTQAREDIESRIRKTFLTRDTYDKFKGSDYFDLDELQSNSLESYNSIFAALGQHDDFYRQEMLEVAESLPQNVYSLIAGVYTAGKFGGFNVSSPLRALALEGTIQAGGSFVGGGIAFGNKWVENRNNPLYQIYTDKDGNNVDPVQAQEDLAMAQMSGEGKTYNDIGYTVEPNDWMQWGHATAEGASETIPEFVGGLITRYLSAFGSGKISETGLGRLKDYVLGWAIQTGINVPEEGVTEWITQLSQDYADAHFRGENFNLNASLERAEHAYLMGAYSAPLLGTGTNVAGAVSTEMTIRENIAKDPTWIQQQNLINIYSKQLNKMSPQSAYLMKLEEELKDPGLAESYRNSLSRQVTELRESMRQSDVQAVDFATRLFQNNVGLATDMRVLHQQQLLQQAVIQQAVDGNASQEIIDQLVTGAQVLQERMDGYMDAASLAVSENTVAWVRDGNNQNTETTIVSRPSTKEESARLEGLQSQPTEQDLQNQDEAESGIQEYDDNLDAQVEREEDYLLIQGVDEEGNLMQEGKVDNETFDKKFQEGVLDTFRQVSPLLNKETSTLAYGTKDQFLQDPNVREYIKTHGNEPAALAVFNEDGTVIDKIIINPETTRFQAVHEIAHATLRPLLNNPVSRQQLAQDIINMGKRKGNDRLAAWIDSLLYDYANQEARNSRKGKRTNAADLNAMEQEELVVEFLTSVATNDWVVTGGRQININETTLEKMAGSFWTAVSKLSPAAKKLNVGNRVGLTEVSRRFKDYVPQIKSKEATNFVRSAMNTSAVKVVPNTKQEVETQLQKPVQKPVQKLETEQAQVAQEEAVKVPEAKPEGAKQQPVAGPEAQTEQINISEKRSDESDEQYRARLEREATAMLEGFDDVSTPDTDALSQETDDISTTPGMAAMQRGKKDFISGKKVVGVYFNGYGYPRTFEITPNDYFHFRNWHNRITGNSSQPFADLYYVDANGVKKDLRAPKQKLDKQGTPVKMKPVDIRTALRKFSQAKDALATAKDTNLTERTNRLNRVMELAKENNIPLEDIGLKGVLGPGAVTYAQVEEAEVILSAKISDQPGTAYPLGIVSPTEIRGIKIGEWQRLTPETVNDYYRGREKGYAAIDRSGKRGGSDRVSFKREVPLEDLMAHSMKPTIPNVMVAKDYIEGRMAIDAIHNLEGALIVHGGVNYAPTDTGRAVFKYTPRGEDKSKTVSFKVPGGILTPAIDAVNYEKRNGGRKASPKDIAAVSFTTAGARNVIENLIQKAREARNQGATIADKAIILVKQLATDNPYGDPKVFEGIIKILNTIVQDDFMAHEALIKELNDILMSEKTGPKNPITGKTSKVYKYQSLFDKLRMNDRELWEAGFEKVTREGGREERIVIINEERYLEGWETFVKLLANAESDANMGFTLRKDIMNSLLYKLSLKKHEAFGFPTKEEVQAMVNLDGINPDGISQNGEQKYIGMYVIDIAAAEKIAIKDKNKSYNIGLSGYEQTILFENPMSEEEFLTQSRTQQIGGGTSAQTSGIQALASLRRGGRIYHQGQGQWEKSTANKYGAVLSAIAIKLQDKFENVNLLQEDIQAFKNEMVNADQDFIMATDLMYGRTAYRLEALEATQEMLQDRMKEFGIKSDDLSDYLYAKHVKERNLHINKINPNIVTGSGKTNKWADQRIAELETAQMKQLANMVYSIIDNTRKTMVEFGLETQDTIDAWTDMYDYYVPLAGLAKDEVDENNLAYPSGGAGMAVYGHLIKKAKGRKSEVSVNIIAQVVMQNAMVIQAAEKNKALRSMYNLVKENPSDVWGINNAEFPLTALDDSGAARKMTVAEMKLNPHTVPVRIDGKQEFIYFKDPNYANTLNGMTVERANMFARISNHMTSWLRNVLTIYDPNFFLANFLRDFQTAIPNALAETERGDGNIRGINPYEFTGSAMKNIFGSVRSLFAQNAFGKDMSPRIEKYKQEWEEAGGKTGWGFTKEISDIIDELERASGDKTARDVIFGGAKKFTSYVEGLNDVFEQATRLGAYIAAREQGVSIEKAAQLSKNVTVNFNRGGEWQFLNSVYLFFNASVQGSTRLFRSMFYLNDVRKANGELDSWHKRVTLPQKIAFAMSTFSALTTMLNLAMSGRDDEGDGELWYNKISDYEKERNLIFMHKDGKNYTKIPLPYGYNTFNNLGSTIVETSTGNRDAASAGLFLLNSMFSSFSPVSFGQSKDLVTYTGKAVTPTVFKPIVEVMANETYFGSQITQERLPFATTPSSDLAFRSPEFLQEFFAWMNEATGGSKYKSGDIDINPDAAWYFFEYYIGSAGRFVGNTGGLLSNMYEQSKTSYEIAAENGVGWDDFKNITAGFQGDNKIKMHPNEIPIVRKVYGEPGKYYDFDLFKNNSFELQQLYREMTKQPVFGDPMRYRGVPQMHEMLKSTTDILQTIRDQRKAARDIKDPTEKANTLYMLEERERLVMSSFNGIYERYRGKKED